MSTTANRFVFPALCALLLATPLAAQESEPRTTPLENIRRALVGESKDTSHPTRRPLMRSSATRGERTTPQRSRNANQEAAGGGNTAAVERAPQRQESEPMTEAEPAQEVSRRRPAALVEQEDAVPAQATRRPTSSPISEEPAPVSEPASAPPAAEPVRAVSVPAPKAATPSTPAAQSAPGGVLFARKGPLLRTETIGPQTTLVGKPATYTIRVQNLGEIAAEAVVVQVQLPEWAEVVSTQPTRGNVRPPEKGAGGAAMQWQLPALDGRGIEELSLQIVLRRSQRFNLAVSWSAAPTVCESPIEVLEPKLELAISGPRDVLFGDTKTYRLTVSNPGTGDAEQVGIQLMPIEGGSQPAAAQVIGTVPAGQSKTLEIELTARRAGTIKINALATADSGLKTEAVEEVLVRRAGLKVQVAAPPMKYAGTPCNYTIHVHNPGDAQAQKVSVEATLPSGAQQAEPSAGGTVSADGTKVTWKIDALGPGQHQALQLGVMLQSPGANQLRVTADAAGDLADNGTATTNVEALADLKLEVSDPTGPVAVGEEATYEIRIRNRGTTSANGVETVGFFSEGVEPVRAQGGKSRVASGQVVFQPISSLAAGSEVVLKISAKATQPGNHVFRAEVRCRSLGTQLVGEETTLFYQAGGAAAQTAQRPQPAPSDAGARPINR